jgi:ArsR family transcriptional regulator, virulence genes transcriptional regulator
MKKYEYELYHIKAVFCKTLADPNRLMMITELRSGEKTVGQIAEIIEISQSTASHHLAKLREAGIVRARRERSSTYYSLAIPKIAKACDIVHEILLSQMVKNKEFADRIMS